MMVTFVSQCNKNALKKTRRVLDAFANRIGDNTWQTVITEDGLLTVKKMLRKTASKSTAVSCHWIRSRSRSQFLWVVGNKSKFNSEGIVPVNSTRRNLLNSEIENDWKYLPLIKSLTALSALFHDWGKASRLFQEKLNPNSKNKFKGDPLRHEWISVLLLNALVNNKSDETWLSDLIGKGVNDNELKQSVKAQNLTPLDRLPNAAKLLAWLIVSHHRLPYIKSDWRDEKASDLPSMLKRITQEWGYENKIDPAEYNKRVKHCFEFPSGLLSESKEWRKKVKRWATSLINNLPLLEAAMKDGSYRLILHHARLCLMLGDHYYSSQDAAKNWQDSTGLFANTDRETSELKQKLDEHLVGVAKNALNTAHLLPAFEKEPPVATDIQVLRKASPTAFKWQDKAVTKINEWKTQQDKKVTGFFAVNMASTGCGKTFANAKVMRALSADGKSLRYILALGLRTLTLQTGDEYRDRIGLTNADLAVLIGSRAVAELHNQREIKQDEITDEVLGSESQEALLDEFIDYDCEIPEEGLSTVLTCTKDKQFLYAPVLACTIDHLMAATETKRGGRYILPSLRLMSSDVVIDEIDDFTGNDLIAIGRLIHLAGMLGRKVMISSATIPPDLALGYFNAYKNGWKIFTKSRDEAKAEIGCAWIDEFTTQVDSISVAQSESAIEQYQLKHSHFIDKRVNSLSKQVAKRKADIVPCPLLSIDESTPKNEAEESKQSHYFSTVKQATLAKHSLHYDIDPTTGIKVSFGVIRVANITPCVELTKYLLHTDYPEDTQVKVMAYHSQQVLLLRHEQEKHLDDVLKRKEKAGVPQQAFSNSVIRNHLDSCAKNNSYIKNMLFILVATPVEEVGRDHDFDWAIIEPSSYRSIVQLAGRVRRHRAEAVELANIGVMQYNLKAFKTNDKPDGKYFVKPGYEDGWDKSLHSHDLNKLVNETCINEGLNAIPRIKVPTQADKQLLAFIEHKVTAAQLTNFSAFGANTLQGYLTETWYLTALPQVLTPFRKSEASINLFLFYNENTEQCYFTEKDEKGKPLVDINDQVINRETILNIKKIELTEQQRQNLWFERNYQSLLTKYLSEPWLATPKRVSLRYGEINMVERENAQYEYNDQFGLVRVNKKGGQQC
ncbi:type I-F CRISPR-associated helicase Cas3f [Catenovulum adriaticum]|uniref:Type I-F CRISPR-associated helicase Cas3f n=1 Tax=Catenovulum adriaticum TaxID=2984846 RepID=A0ABY7APT4_9ALTE|nr:type I-F CRISPR-associated helicase Cas3f [Catenovulum sp. TS8]WAJ71258.1 type I-F CRISPR-associated helicase Cas3f [Catenovulum sp. TS8]